jgi:hypothetical protein
MMRWDSFARSTWFAAVAALAWVPWLVLVGAVMGPSTARTLYLVAVTSAYVGGLGGRLARRLPAVLVTGIAGSAVAVVGRDPTVLCLGLGVVLAVARSAFLYRTLPARAVVTEAVLAGGGLGFARLLAFRSPVAMALPIWGFFLVQSCFFLVAGVRERRADGGHQDPFEAAHARAMEVLERPIRSAA